MTTLLMQAYIRKYAIIYMNGKYLLGCIKHISVKVKIIAKLPLREIILINNTIVHNVSYMMKKQSKDAQSVIIKI